MDGGKIKGPNVQRHGVKTAEVGINTPASVDGVTERLSITAPELGRL